MGLRGVPLSATVMTVYGGLKIELVYRNDDDLNGTRPIH